MSENLGLLWRAVICLAPGPLAFVLVLLLHPTTDAVQAAEAGNAIALAAGLLVGSRWTTSYLIRRHETTS
jgi:hypothetical protein